MRESLSARTVQKRYGGVEALADGNLEVHPGEILALVGANGSGKSTLSKIITGVVAPDTGQLLLDGQEVSFPSPHNARERGITAVYQELSLIPDLAVSQNIWLAHEPLRFGIGIDNNVIRERTIELLELFGDTFPDPARVQDEPVRALPPDERQIVEILKALSQDPSLLILDEATASLDSQQVGQLFKLMESWKAEGMALVFITHRMEEVFQVADRVSVLRNGRTVDSMPIGEATEEKLVHLMTEGRAAEEVASKRPEVESGELRLKVEGLEAGVLRGVSLELREGELLGIGGLQGQGQTDLMMALFGAIRYEGRVEVLGEPVQLRHPRDAMLRGLALVPGDRNSEGLLIIRSILENLQLPSWPRYGVPLSMGRARSDAQEISEELNLVMASLDAPVSSLSGGNAQKVVLGKWLMRNPKIMLLNDPTKGVDVGTKREFYELLAELRARGTAILFYSSEDEELLGLCDRVLVMLEGRVREELSGESLTSEQLISASMGTESGA